MFDQINLCVQQIITPYNEEKEKMKPLTVQKSHYPPHQLTTMLSTSKKSYFQS